MEIINSRKYVMSVIRNRWRRGSRSVKKTRRSSPIGIRFWPNRRFTRGRFTSSNMVLKSVRGAEVGVLGFWG